MSRKEIILKISNNRFNLNPRLSISLAQTNIPEESLSFRTSKEFYWLLEMLRYDGPTELLHVRVLDYDYADTLPFLRQEPKKPVAQMHFESLDWEKLEIQLSTYQKRKLGDLLVNVDAPSKPDEADYIIPKSISYKLPIIAEAPIEQPRRNTPERPNTENKQILKDILKIPFEELKFKLGYIAFRRFIPAFEVDIDFKITNEHLLAEFEPIKFWFAKKLKTKTINVSIRIEVDEDGVLESYAKSAQIDQITPDFIEGVKYQRTAALLKTPKISDINKALFSSEDIFDQLDTKDQEGNAFQQSEMDILGHFLAEANIRNKQQLQYLAGNKQSENHPLRYTLAPHFGFLFLIEGEENNHFVWELLNSHATYIWSIEKGEQAIHLQFKRIEATINSIRNSGRGQYKQAYHSSHIDEDLVFRVLNHESIHSNFSDAFLKWKHRLNEHLT